VADVWFLWTCYRQERKTHTHSRTPAHRHTHAHLFKKKTLTLDRHVKMESLNAHCLDHQSANMTPPSTHCDLPDGMLQMVRAPDKSPRTGA